MVSKLNLTNQILEHIIYLNQCFGMIIKVELFLCFHISLLNIKLYYEKTKMNCMKCKFLKLYAKYLFTKYYSNMFWFNIMKNVLHLELYEKYHI